LWVWENKQGGMNGKKESKEKSGKEEIDIYSF
jgi:hypothetical protein